MKNMLDYIKEFGHVSFEERAFSEIDALVLTELEYLPLEKVVPSDENGEDFVTVKEIAEYMQEHKQELFDENPMMITEERHEVSQVIADAPRFQSLKFFGVVSEWDKDTTKQFAAITVEVEPSVRLVVFRGTDDTLIGWKEDFLMTYSPLVAAQTDAKEYLAKQASLWDGDLMISGHSKGGNLAIYAAATQVEDVQLRIVDIFCFDSPGLYRSVLETKGYQNIVPLAMRYIPQDSLVGLMLESEVPYVIVKSNATGAMQHSAMTWEIEDGQFIKMEKLTKNSQLNDQTFKKWTESVSDEELELFWNVFFELLFAAGIDTVNDLYGQFMHYVQEFLKATGEMDEEKREVLTRIALLLVSTRFEVWRDSLDMSELVQFEMPEVKLPTWDELMTTLSWKKNGFEVHYRPTEENEEIRAYYQKRHEQKKHEEK
ncbi:DUF2974 domain-containing protein [Streptococcus sp. 263_SSPC]|uniref:DUF2974 domain-containing protein n=1 Tax=Streptococcus sp. 263_SSPC TaxID=1579343 RepID=UPI000B03BDF3|nr:DUF2974 domain-containing protein [Streptococcus sp. 263_SSPC]